MLSNLGAQKTVKYVNGVPTNTFKYNAGAVSFPSAGALLQSDLGGGVVGNYSASAFNSTKCFFLSRGAGQMYAEAMTGLAIDTAAMLGISPQAMLERFEVGGKLELSPNAYRALNNLRDPGNQVGTVTTVSNKHSLQARAIRP
jgi:hypothetical protein